jgi:hypothetical protein
VAFFHAENIHVRNQDTDQNDLARKGFARRNLPRLTVATGAAGVALLATMAIPTPANAADVTFQGTTASFQGTTVTLSPETVDLLNSGDIGAAIDQYQSDQQQAADAQTAKQQDWRDQQAADALAAQQAADAAQQAAVAAQQAAGDVQSGVAPSDGSAVSDSSGSTSPSSSAPSISLASTRAVATTTAVATSAGSGFTALPNVSRKIVNGDITANQAGQVIDSVDVHGRIIVKAPNVTIKNSIVRGADGGSANGLVDAMSGQTGLKIYDTKIAATKANSTVNGIMGWNFELHNVDISNVIDSVDIAGSNVVIADSWLHNNVHYANDTSHADGSHDDNVQILGGSNITITRTSLSGAWNAAVMIAPDRASISNVAMTGNQIDGGGCSINIAEKGKGSIPGISVRDSKFGTAQRNKGCAIVSPTSTAVATSGNTWLSGLVVALTKGS